MTRKINMDGLESAPRWIVMFLAAYLIVHLLVLYLWNAAGQIFSIQGTSDGSSALSITAMGAVELWLCLVVLRSFPAGAPLRPAWLLITAAAGARAASGVAAQVLGTGSAWTEQIRQGALIAGGPVRLIFLAAGLAAILGILRRYGFWARPSVTDWAVSGMVGVFTLCRFGEALLGSRPVGLEDWISMAGLPVLCVLFLEAMLLRQSIARMGNGLITRGWMALMCGVLLTGAGEAALWVIPHYSGAASQALFGALIRLPVAAAFALVPAYQVAAQRRAVAPVSSQAQDLATGVPALAR